MTSNTNDDVSPLLNPFFSIEDKDWIKLIDKRYNEEELVLECIRIGDVERVRSLMYEYDTKVLKSFSYLSSDMLLLAKMCCRVSNITYRIAARQGGLLPLYTHNVSEKFAVKIMQINEVEKLLKLPRVIAESYAKAVKEFSCNRYSPEIATAIKYIVYNLTDKISLHELAENIYTSPTALSRKFKKETGFTVVEYINYMRIQTAKVLILKDVGNITEIANMVGYSDAGYFTKNFTKYSNTNPKNYKEQNLKDRL